MDTRGEDFRLHVQLCWASLNPPPRLGPKWGKWADRLSDFVKYKGYLKNHTTSQTTYPTLSECTLLIFCTKCEGKFVSVAPTRKMLLSMCSVLAWAGGRAGILTDSRKLCQPIRGKLRLCQPMTGCVWEHATIWRTESAIFKKV